MCFFNLFRKKPVSHPPQTGTGDDMLIVNNLSGFGGGGTLSLTQKGYGYIESASTGNLALSYGNVSSGSAPSAGDLVVWIVEATDNSAQAINDLTGSGWTQSRAYVSTLIGASILAKVVSASDIASPPTGVTSPVYGAAGMWIAYTVSGSITSLAANSLTAEYSGTSAPSNQTPNASASSRAIMLSLGLGSDNAMSIAWSGATADISLERTNVMSNGSLIVDIKYLAKLGVPGDSVTISMGDDGSLNALASGYIAVA